MCFSKGLGAPVGSAVAGDRAVIERVRVFRKRFGGGMRQAGVLAAAAIYALDHHVEGIAGGDGIEVDPDGVETNIVFFGAPPGPDGAAGFCRSLEEAGVRTFPEGGDRVRAVFHLEITAADAKEAAARVLRTAASFRG
jgi:threonine aldolase